MQHQLFDTIIIGAGFAGVSAAVQLAQAGCSVALMEARAEPGGRARTVESGFGTTDNGQHLLMGCYADTFATLDALGTLDHIWRTNSTPIQFFADGSTHAVVPGPTWLPDKNRFAWGLLKGSLLSARDKRALLRVFTALLVGTSPKGCTVEQWLERKRQPKALVHKFWEPLCLATINAEISVADASLLWQVLTLAFLGPKGASDFAFATCPLSELLNPVATVLSNNNSVFAPNSNVKSIRREGEEFSIHTKKQHVFRSRSVVVATPPSAAEKLCSELPVTNMPTLQYSPIASLYVRLSQPVHLPIMTAGIGTTTQWVFNSKAIALRQHSSPTIELTVTVSAAAAAAKSRDAFVDVVLKELKLMFPSLNHTDIVDTHLIIEKRATPVFTPEVQPTRPKQQTSVPGLFLAGDYTQTQLPSTIESAAKSGRLAANLAHSFLKPESS